MEELNSMSMENINIENIESHYNTIFYKVLTEEAHIFLFEGGQFTKKDNCKLFIKYMIKVIDFYLYEYPETITVILNLEDMHKEALNIDFIVQFVKKFKKIYENRIILRKFYILHCPSKIKTIYNFIKTFLHPETKEKIKLIKPEKSLSVEEYYYN